MMPTATLTVYQRFQRTQLKSCLMQMYWMTASVINVKGSVGIVLDRRVIVRIWLCAWLVVCANIEEILCAGCLSTKHDDVKHAFGDPKLKTINTTDHASNCYLGPWQALNINQNGVNFPLHQLHDLHPSLFLFRTQCRAVGIPSQN